MRIRPPTAAAPKANGSRDLAKVRPRREVSPFSRTVATEGFGPVSGNLGLSETLKSLPLSKEKFRTGQAAPSREYPTFVGYHQRHPQQLRSAVGGR
jgi:hypothetical protein